MGQPVRIVELAERMIVLSGLEPGHDIDIVFTGIRRGERLMELLFARDEPRSEIGIEGIMAVRPVTPPTAAMQGLAGGARAWPCRWRPRRNLQGAAPSSIPDFRAETP